ncbi:DASH family cryptochrome [Aliiglaciecola sp. CAU 1673]|uniref:DASH family cryptochrome n=1 Tax=Aliiglaciecola sp. CAU 1673 TaxID=3032595 RepID=UPI0023DC7033|nr:DASH family cryptochrome [Aliiglaciecola sp. CAU 1673]MDF2180048.1 DASH family cryptochrome [Aliiglaciecola sp. CAU 1673]
MISDTAVLLFTDDLRLDDNPTLYAAAKHQRLLCLFVFDEILMRDEQGFGATGPIRAHFLWQSVKDLANNLQAIGQRLHILQGRMQTVLSDIQRQLGSCTFYLQSPTGCYERRRLQQLQSQFDIREIGGKTLLNEADLPMAVADIPKPFTTFRKAVESQWPDIHALSKPAHLPPTPSVDLPPLLACPLPIFAVLDKRAALHFEGGESKASLRLTDYIWKSKALEHYKQSRNGLVGADYSSKFSPWLANGSLSPRRIYQQVKAYEVTFGANESTYWLIFELLWRDYFQFCALRDGGNFFTSATPHQPNLDNPHEAEAFERWRLGRTGEDFVDANMQELLHTGFMSNRGRQNVASYLIHDLGVDWRRGAAWFEHQLIDYDPASNYGNWAYLAGDGMDPRGGRHFNLQKQAERYDPAGRYVRHWLHD